MVWQFGANVTDQVLSKSQMHLQWLSVKFYLHIRSFKALLL